MLLGNVPYDIIVSGIVDGGCDDNCPCPREKAPVLAAPVLAAPVLAAIVVAVIVVNAAPIN